MNRPPAPVAPPSLERLGERAFENGAKISAEFFAISYGSLVRQILATCDENIDAVNHQLDELGGRIGMRLIEEYVAKAQAPPMSEVRTHWRLNRQGGPEDVPRYQRNRDQRGWRGPSHG